MYSKTKLERVLELHRGYDLPERERKEGNVPIISSSGYSGLHNDCKCDGENVITGRYGTIGEVFYHEGKCWPLNTALYVSDFKENNPKYVYYLLKYILKMSIDGKDKSTVPGVDRNVLHQMEIPFCQDIKEQKELIRILEKLDERIDLNRKINDNLVATLQIIYKKMFLESQNTYITKPLADLCSKIGSGATPKGGKAAYFDKGISLIRSMNVFDYFFSYPELAHISQIQANALANVEIQQADVLFNITGVSVTRCCVVPDDVLPARVNQHVMIIRPYKGKNMSYYIMCTLCTSENKAKLLGIGQSGSTREAINKQELERFEIPVPSDEELERFGEIATKIYALIFSNTNEIRMLCDMKDTLLTKLSSY